MRLWDLVRIFRNKIEAQFVSYNPNYSVEMYDTVVLKDKLTIYRRRGRAATSYIIDPR